MANTKSLWLRLYTEILNDPKVQRLPDSLFRAYINFLCIAKEYSDDGALPPKKDIAFFLRCPQKTVEKLCDGLQKNELLDADGDTFIIHGWNNRQYESDNDPTANIRKRRQRERNKNQNVTPDVTDMSRVTSRPCHENVTRTETETETDIRESKRETPPSAASPPLPEIQKPKKSPYGEFGNVSLTDEERHKLIERYGESQTQKAIESLGAYMKSKGKSYRDHYATLLNWIKKDGVPERTPDYGETHKSDPPDVVVSSDSIRAAADKKLPPGLRAQLKDRVFVD